MCMLSAHHETLRRVCIMRIVDGFCLALDVSGLMIMGEGRCL